MDDLVTDFAIRTSYALDPAFETLHPRDPKGEWIDKPVSKTPAWVDPAMGVPGAPATFVTQVMRNLEQLAETPLSFATRARLTDALRFAFTYKDAPLTTTAQVSAFVTEIAARVSGWTPAGTSGTISPLVRELAQQWNIPRQNPVVTASWIERIVDSAQQPLGAASEHTARVLAAFTIRRGGFHQPRYPSRDEFYSHLRSDRRDDWMDFYTGMLLPTYARRFAADPEFEGKHPRDPKGQWADKPGGPEPNVSGGSSIPTPDPQQGGFEAMRKNMIERFGMTPEQASAQIEGMQQLTARLAGPTKATPTNEQARGTRPGFSFPGQCYEMAGRYMLDHIDDLDATDYTLVHGVIDQSPFGDMRIGHGWVETADGKVFDATTQEWSEKESYYKTFNAVSEQRYSAREARRMIFSKENWGCWHASAGVVNNQMKTPRRSRQRAKVAA